MTHSRRRLNSLAEINQASRYLEIGVHKGQTFFDVAVTNKVAVDPQFRFSYADMNSDSLSFYETSSDLFFSHACGRENFDLIFFDGLHVFEQTTKDVLNAIWVSHARTIWLIDDVLPNDPYSACRNQSQAYALRKQAGLISKAWHGDVYKVVFFIHDFLPNLSYCTIRDGGNPQTVVWQHHRTATVPRFGSMELISRLSYFDLMDNLDILNLVEGSEALCRVHAAFA